MLRWMKSMAGSDQLKSAWNSASMTTAKISAPQTRCVSTPSSRAVHDGRRTAGCRTTSPTMSSTCP